MERTEFRMSCLGMALIVSCSACDSSPTGSDEDRSQIVVAFAALAPTAPSQANGEPFVRPCPAGGRIIVEGVTTFENGGSVSITKWDNAIRFEGCALTNNGRTAVADGHLNTMGEAHFGEPVNQHAPVVYQQSQQVGTITTLYNGTSNTCTYDMHHEYDAGSDRYRISGTACGRSVDFTAPSHP